jgi:hypothetical protein
MAKRKGLNQTAFGKHERERERERERESNFVIAALIII